MSKLLSLFVVLLISSSLHGQERNWSDNTGNFNVDAVLVGVEDDIVILRKSDDGELQVPLSRLSKNDQQFVQQWKMDEAKKSETSDSPTKDDWNADIKTKATGKREAGFDYDFNSKAPMPEVTVQVEIFGKAAAKAISYGKLKIDSFKDGKGADLKILVDEFGPDIAKEMEKINKRGDDFFGHPSDGIRFEIKSMDKAGSVKKVSLVEGQVDVLTGGTSKTETIKDVSTYKNGSVTSDLFKELGVKCEFTRTANAVKIKLEGEARLASLKFVNAKGKEVEPDGWSSGGWDESWEYSFDFDKIPVADLVLEYRLDPVTVTLPFSAKNVSIEKR